MAFCRQSSNGSCEGAKTPDGLLAAVVVAAGGFFGFEFYVQPPVESEVEAAFAPIRAAGGKASHGKVAFDLGAAPSRSPTSRRIGCAAAGAVQDRQPRPPTVVSQPEAARFDAEIIEVTDIEFGLQASRRCLQGANRPQELLRPGAAATGLDRLGRRPTSTVSACRSSSLMSARRRSRRRQIDIGLPRRRAAHTASYTYPTSRCAI